MRLAIRAVLVCLVILLVLELGLRFLGYGQYIIYRSDPSLLWVPLANQEGRTVAGHEPITINSDGLRYPGDLDKRDPREVRIYTFGDSVTMGWGVDDNSHYSAVLEKLLFERHPQSQFRVISAGVNAYPTALCVRRFQNLLEAGHQIDVAVLAYSFNWGIEHFAQMKGKDKERLLRKVELKSVLRRSAVYNFFIEDLLRAAVYYRLRDRLVAGTWEVDTAKGSDEKLNRYLASLEEMRVRADQSGVQLALLLLGSKGQEDLSEHQQAFLEFARSSDVPLVNMVDVLRDSSQESLYMYGDVNHPNAGGHTLIAEQLLPVVTKLAGSGSSDDLDARQ